MREFSGDERERIIAGQRRLGLGPETVWILYVAVGGDCTEAEIRSYLDGTAPLPPGEISRLAAAIDDEFVVRGQDHPVRTDLDPPG